MLQCRGCAKADKPKGTFNGYKNTKCYKCGKTGHIEANCPN